MLKKKAHDLLTLCCIALFVLLNYPIKQLSNYLTQNKHKLLLLCCYDDTVVLYSPYASFKSVPTHSIHRLCTVSCKRQISRDRSRYIWPSYNGLLCYRFGSSLYCLVFIPHHALLQNLIILQFKMKIVHLYDYGCRYFFPLPLVSYPLSL